MSIQMIYDAIIVGAGFAGATIAHELAENGKKVLLIDKREQIGGNMYDYSDTNGVLVHKYGPHIFHTNYKDVFDYLKKFGEFFFYQHKVIGNIDGVLVPIPFNFTSLEKLFPNEKAKLLEEKLLTKFNTRVSIFDLINDDDQEIKEFGQYVYEKVFVYYTAKQWNIHPDKIDKSVINRVPVVLGYNDLYFADEYQYMPTNGFTSIFNNMLNHKNIKIKLNTCANDVLKFDEESKSVFVNGEQFKGLIVYTGAIDELFDYKYGQLPYRSLELVFEQHNQTHYQENSVVNYPTSEKFTRITEFKYLANQHIEGKTTILKEYSKTYDLNDPKANTPYYPINNSENNTLYEQYKNEAEKYGLILCGRLAEYKYYNMDAVIKKALEISKSLIK